MLNASIYSVSAQEARAREALAEAADAGADPGEAAEPASEPENEMEAERAANISRNNRALADFGLAPDALPPGLAPGRGAAPHSRATRVLGLLGWARQHAEFRDTATGAEAESAATTARWPNVGGRRSSSPLRLSLTYALRNGVLIVI